MKLTDTSIPPIPLSCVYYKRKYVHEEKLKEKWPADSYFSTLIVNDDLSMGDKSCGNYSMNKHTTFHQYCDSNNGDVISRYGF